MKWSLIHVHVTLKINLPQSELCEEILAMWRNSCHHLVAANLHSCIWLRSLPFQGCEGSTCHKCMPNSLKLTFFSFVWIWHDLAALERRITFSFLSDSCWRPQFTSMCTFWQKFSDELEKEGCKGKMPCYYCNVTKEEDVLQMFKKINEEHGGIDVLINNAGLTRDAPLLSGDVKDWNIMLQARRLDDPELHFFTICSLLSEWWPSLVVHTSPKWSE